MNWKQLIVLWVFGVLLILEFFASSATIVVKENKGEVDKKRIEWLNSPEGERLRRNEIKGGNINWEEFHAESLFPYEKKIDATNVLGFEMEGRFFVENKINIIATLVIICSLLLISFKGRKRHI